MTKHGRFATAAPGAVSHMPAFANVLSDADIMAVIVFIKRRWPLGLRISQAMLNPGYARMPPDASRVALMAPSGLHDTIFAPAMVLACRRAAMPPRESIDASRPRRSCSAENRPRP